MFYNVPSGLKSLMNENAQFKTALKQYWKYIFYSVEEFLLRKNDSFF
jgi:hypothetical protein